MEDFKLKHLIDRMTGSLGLVDPILIEAARNGGNEVLCDFYDTISFVLSHLKEESPSHSVGISASRIRERLFEQLKRALGNTNCADGRGYARASKHAVAIVNEELKKPTHSIDMWVAMDGNNDPSLHTSEPALHDVVGWLSYGDDNTSMDDVPIIRSLIEKLNLSPGKCRKITVSWEEEK